MKKAIMLTTLVCVPRHRDWYYMKFLHLQTWDKFSEINFELNWKEPATKECSAHKFCHAYKVLIFPSSPFLLDNTRLHRVSTKSFEKLLLWKVNWRWQMSLSIYSKLSDEIFFSKNLLSKSCKAFFKVFNYRFFGLLFKI